MKRKVLSVLSILAGLVLVNSGADKFFHYIPMPPDLPEEVVKAGMAFAAIGWLLPLVATVEIIGGLLLIFGRTRPLGVIVALPVLIGAFLANANMAPEGLPIVIVLMMIVFWITYENREKYLALINPNK